MSEQAIIDSIASVLGLDPSSSLGATLAFFIYDSAKIMLLLFGMIMLMGIVRTYISQEMIRKSLSGRKGPASNLAASGFGAVTPFCSCSSIPIFISMLRSGVPLGVSFSFLITSPLVNEYLVIVMFALFGLKITAVYVASGIIIGVACGLILGKLGLEKELSKDIAAPCACGCKSGKKHKEKAPETFKERLSFGWHEAVSITKKLWMWILVAVGIGALIHNYIPTEMIESAISGVGVFSVPLATLLGVPMYGSCAAILPIAAALLEKGVPLGTALSFMMGVSALSIPEATLLKRAMSLKLVAIFFAIVAVSIIFTGYAFNMFEGLLI
jgi:uncharacterized protein